MKNYRLKTCLFLLHHYKQDREKLLNFSAHLLKICSLSYVKKSWLAQIILTCVTALLCTVVSPFLVKASSLYPAIPTQSNISAPTTLLEEAKTLYEQGQFTSAIKIWQQALSGIADQGDLLRQAMILNDLSLAYQHLGRWPQASEAITKGLGLLNRNISSSKSQIKVKAHLLNTQGRLQLAQGKPEQALTTWQQAASTYAKAGDQSGVVIGLVNQSQALQSLGSYREALDILAIANKKLSQQPDSLLKAAELRSLGNVWRVVGNLEKSRQFLKQSLVIANQLRADKDIGEALMSLGNLARAQQDNQSALDFYRQAAAAEPSARIESELNQLTLLLQSQQLDNAKTLLPHLQGAIANLPPSHDSIYARISLAQSLTQLKQSSTTDFPSQVDITNLLTTAIQQAKSLGDQRAEAYAIGHLGGLYEQTHQWPNAKSLTQQALILAQSINAPDIGYRWQWQMGRLLKAQGDIKGAIAAYSQSVEDLKALRNNLVGINTDIQFSFREQVEPIYRQLVDLLLASDQPSQDNLKAARQTIESLQVAELNNFFRVACLEGKEVQLDDVVDKQDPSAAVLYPIILPDRLEVILKLPKLPLVHYKSLVNQHDIESVLSDLRAKFSQPENVYKAQSLSKQVYDWLLRPAEEKLGKSNVKTLVFVLDGYLRNIPMPALYDGREYLVQKYATALAPGLTLLPPKLTKNIHLKALAGGISQQLSGLPYFPNVVFSSLPNVRIELAQIKSELTTTALLDQEFNIKALQKRINSNPFSVVHFATHGQFSSQADQTFILAWDGPIFVNALNTLLQSRDTTTLSPIELLVLSACETAAGDNRAILGLAGVAVRAGARSTLATLWSVKDDSTAILMNHFYHNLVDSHLTKAEALRQAQLALLKNPNVYRAMSWMPYVLLGNWL